MLDLIAAMRETLDKMESVVMRMFNKPQDNPSPPPPAPVAEEPPVVDDGDSAAEPVPDDMPPATDSDAKDY